MNSSIFDEFDVICTYTRAQALEDGVLVDVSSVAKEAGISFPTAVTSSVWYQYILPLDKLEACGQSISGRLGDLLHMLRRKALKTNSSLLYFHCLFLGYDEKHEEVKFKALCGPGDNHEPVITIMLPHED
jgi:hypothetical protein